MAVRVDERRAQRPAAVVAASAGARGIVRIRRGCRGTRSDSHAAAADPWSECGRWKKAALMLWARETAALAAALDVHAEGPAIGRGSTSAAELHRHRRSTPPPAPGLMQRTSVPLRTEIACPVGSASPPRYFWHRLAAASERAFAGLVTIISVLHPVHWYRLPPGSPRAPPAWMLRTRHASASELDMAFDPSMDQLLHRQCAGHVR
jgi:hypothetical protein